LNRILQNKREFYAGGLVILFGIVAIVQGLQLHPGTLRNMGPGYVPVALGVILFGLGVAIVLVGSNSNEENPVILDHPEWRGWLCILAGGASFIVLATYTGMLLASFFCVFISALGDRTASLRGATALSIGVTIFGVLLFHYLLKVPMPLFTWDW